MAKNTLEKSNFKSRVRSLMAVYIFAIVTVISISSTIFFAYNSSLESPYLAALVAKSPERTILILNIMSQLSLHFLAELTTLVLDATRWALAYSSNGTSALTFLILSQATGLLDAVYLAFGSDKIERDGKYQRYEHKFWGGQK
jgi:hypothetical protein